MAESISFDHAADTYDATRALPDDINSKLTGALATEIAAVGAERILEVGVGTGRISRPLAARGIDICGVDIAPRMIAKLREQLTPTHAPVDLTLADATRLPFAAASFRAVVIVHVLHLVSPWQQAIDEIVRVSGAGGTLLHATTRDLGENPWSASFAKLGKLIAAKGFVQRRRPTEEEIHAALERLGGSCRVEPVAREDVRGTPDEYLDRMCNRVNSWSWQFPEDLFADCLVEFQPWLQEHFGDMQRVLVQATAHELEVWSFA